MTFQFGTTLRNNQAGQIQTTVGSSATLLIYSGSEPANPAASATGTLLCTITLPATFLTSSGGATTIAGTWSTTASATGTAGYFRILDGSSVCHVQGNVTSDLVLNNTSIASGQTVTVTSFTVTMQNQ
jgi:hypothetical protein